MAGKLQYFKSHQFLSRFFILMLLLMVLFLFFYYRLYQYFHLSLLQSYQNQIKDFYFDFPFLTVFMYFIFYVLITGLSIPGAVILTLAGGFLFGLLKGTILVSLASSTGAFVAFLFSRFFIRDFLFEIISQKKMVLDNEKRSMVSRVADSIEKRFGKQMKIISEKMQTEGAYYLFTLRLVPIFPFFIVNLVMGLTSIKACTFFFVSQLGMLPATLLYINAGTQLSKVKAVEDIISFPLLVSFALLGLFPLVIRSFLWRKEGGVP